MPKVTIETHPTMEMGMEPYGAWKTAYAAESRRANLRLLTGVSAFFGSLCAVYMTGTIDGWFMPNLDHVMEETEPWNFDQAGRVSVLNLGGKL